VPCIFVLVSTSCSLYVCSLEAANNIEGSVPREIGHLESLQVLSLQNNLLSGDLENDFCDRHYVSFVTDCLGENSTITCSCCDTCCDKKVCCGALGCREI
jgi:hypothetical protein